MDGRSILLSLLPFGLTLINYAIMRDLIWSILLGSKSKKSALKHRAEAKGMDAFRQTYIEQYLTKYQADYKKWMGIKLVTFILAAVQLIGFTVAILCKVPFWIIAIICGVFVIWNIVMFVLMMKETETSTNKKSTKGSPWKFEQ